MLAKGGGTSQSTWVVKQSGSIAVKVFAASRFTVKLGGFGFSPSLWKEIRCIR